MISKEEFVKAINEVQRVEKYTDELNDVYQKYHVEGYLYPPDCTTTVLDLLHDVFAEADENEWISYFVFELNYGNSYKPGCVVDENGNEIDLSSADKLYDFLAGISKEALNG